MRFALRANGKNAAMDSRSRENDGDVKSPSGLIPAAACPRVGGGGNDERIEKVRRYKRIDGGSFVVNPFRRINR